MHYRKLDFVLEGIIQEHLVKRQQENNGNCEEIEYDLADELINVMKRNDLDMPITKDNIKAVIMVTFIKMKKKKE
jgi:hypothetical protein